MSGRPCPAAWLGRRAGLTLLELLFVLAILAVVLGGGLGALAALDPGPRHVEGALASLLAEGSGLAAERGGGARVRLDAEGRRARLEAFVVVGTWHFEGDLRGAFGLDGQGRETGFDDDGWVGRALWLDAARPAQAAFDVHGAGFELGAGFAVELALRPGDRRGGGHGGHGGAGTLFDLGGAVSLELDGEGRLRGSFLPMPVGGSGAEGSARAGRVEVRSPAGVLAPGRWTRVALSFDGERLALAVEGVPVAEEEVACAVAAPGPTLVLGDDRRGLGLALDALVVRVLEPRDALVLPAGVRFAPPTPELVAFGPDGRLDPRHHAGPCELVLVSERGARSRLVVSARGSVLRR